MRASIVVAALGALLGGWGSCGGTRYSCSYTCGDTETFGFLSGDIVSDSQQDAETSCQSSVPTSCQNPVCNCKVAGSENP